MHKKGYKLCSMKEAIFETVHPGSQLVIDGFTHLISFSAAHEIIRQEIKNLTGIRLTPDLVYDQMLEAGNISNLVFSWAGNPGVGSLHAFRRLVETNSKSKIKIEEWTHFAMVARFLAGGANLPFWPLKSFQGTNLPDVNSTIKFIECPYTGQKLATVPALNPDVAIIHCQRADTEGNAQVWGLLGTQKEVAFASKRVVIVAEEIVPTSLIRQDPNRTLIPSLVVDFVVHEPWGAHPSFAQGYYDRDNDFYVQWDQISRKQETYQEYLQEMVFGVKNRQEYLKKLDSTTLSRLQAKAQICEGVNYGY